MLVCFARLKCDQLFQLSSSQSVCVTQRTFPISVNSQRKLHAPWKPQHGECKWLIIFDAGLQHPMCDTFFFSHLKAAFLCPLFIPQLCSRIGCFQASFHKFSRTSRRSRALLAESDLWKCQGIRSGNILYVWNKNALRRNRCLLEGGVGLVSAESMSET